MQNLQGSLPASPTVLGVLFQKLSWKEDGKEPTAFSLCVVLGGIISCATTTLCLKVRGQEFDEVAVVAAAAGSGGDISICKSFLL